MVRRTQYNRIMLAASIAIGLAGCGTGSSNPSLNSVRQPVVERSTFALDLPRVGDGLTPPELARLDQWFTGIGLDRNDRITVVTGADMPRLMGEITRVAAIHGVASEVKFASDLAQDVAPGAARIVVSRSRAHVPGCPDWSDKSTVSLSNATSSGFGCAINGNLAAMVADPEHLLAGVEGPATSESLAASKAIAAYRDAKPTGATGLVEVSSGGSE